MILGIDVGGTHTDAVLIENVHVRRKAKVLTETENLVGSLKRVVNEIITTEHYPHLKRIVLSTTLSTNAIIQGKVDRVGLILSCGPGMAPEGLRIDGNTHFISGYTNHRGIGIALPKEAEITRISKRLWDEGIRHLGIVGKFSTRNPDQEIAIKEMIRESFPHISLGHRMSGRLNFPRRVSTTYLNAAVWRTYWTFAESMRAFIGSFPQKIPTYILKADGGTFELEKSTEFPARTILSGPAASVMGVLGLTNCSTDALVLDIGGTTTDIALFADGVPLLEPQGAVIGGRKTLIRGLRTHSIGAGGDSAVKVAGGDVVIGPERNGPAAAFGGPDPTPTDAMIVLGLTDIGSREKAERAVQSVAREMNRGLLETAESIYDHLCRKIACSVREFIDAVNSKPVYTIHEMLQGKTIQPKVMYIVGGPAVPMAERLSRLMGCPAEIPPHSEVANAIGAALARTTAEMTVLMDTELGTLTVVEEGLKQKVPPGFSRQDAYELCRERLKEAARSMGGRDEDMDLEIIEDQEFNMVRGFHRVGKNIRIKAQIKPGLIAGFKEGGRIG